MLVPRRLPHSTDNVGSAVGRILQSPGGKVCITLGPGWICMTQYLLHFIEGSHSNYKRYFQHKPLVLAGLEAMESQPRIAALGRRPWADCRRTGTCQEYRDIISRNEDH